MEGELRRGGPYREWLNDIKECGGKEIQTLNRRAHAGSRHVENGGEDGIGHLRELRPRSNGWMDEWMDGWIVA